MGVYNGKPKVSHDCKNPYRSDANDSKSTYNKFMKTN